MRNLGVAVMVVLLMACSHIVHLQGEIPDDELTMPPQISSGRTPSILEEAPSIPAPEVMVLPEMGVFPSSGGGPEGGEGNGEVTADISGPPWDDDTLIFTEPDLPPTEQGPFRGETELWLAHRLPWEDEDHFLEEVGKDLHDEDTLREEEAGGEPEFDIPIVINGEVERFIAYYQTRGRKVFNRWLARSRRYVPLMAELLRENGLPEDLVYLALIESGFNPRAYSRRKAMGLWQFRYQTGRRYGLRVDWWIDERRDPVKSTIAAARYLKDLHDRFECWYLAAAGYNAGEGKISRAIRRYKTEDFWELTKYRYLKRETKNFIPKIIAAALIAKDPETYGFVDIAYQEPIRFETVKVPDATDLRVIAKAAESTYEELKRLNPELRRWCTPPNYPHYELKLPYGKREIFLKNFSHIPPARRITFRRHVVRTGETLSHIALRYRTDVGAIMRMNRVRNRHRIRAGQSLIIPVRGSQGFGKGRVPKESNQERGLWDRREGAFIYTVRRGDTLWEISRSMGVDLESLCRWNGIQNASRIYPGDKLEIRTEGPTKGTEGTILPGGKWEG